MTPIHSRILMLPDKQGSVNCGIDGAEKPRWASALSRLMATRLEKQS